MDSVPVGYDTRQNSRPMFGLRESAPSDLATVAIECLPQPRSGLQHRAKSPKGMEKANGGPRSIAGAGQVYVGRVTATDMDGDPLKFTLLNK